MDHTRATGGESEGVDDQLGLPVLLHVDGDQLVLRELLPALGGNPESSRPAFFSWFGVAKGDPHNLAHLLKPDQPVDDELLLVVEVGRHSWCRHLFCAGTRFWSHLKVLPGPDDVVYCHLVGEDWQQILLSLQSFLDYLSWVELWSITECCIPTVRHQAICTDSVWFFTSCFWPIPESPNALPSLSCPKDDLASLQMCTKRCHQQKENFEEHLKCLATLLVALTSLLLEERCFPSEASFLLRCECETDFHHGFDFHHGWMNSSQTETVLYCDALSICESAKLWVTFLRTSKGGTFLSWPVFGTGLTSPQIWLKQGSPPFQSLRSGSDVSESLHSHETFMILYSIISSHIFVEVLRERYEGVDRIF